MLLLKYELCFQGCKAEIAIEYGSSPYQTLESAQNLILFFLCCRIIDLLITVVFQLLFMRDLEKIIGTWRIIIVYIGSGIAGSLASAIFIPYHVEVSNKKNTICKAALPFEGHRYSNSNKQV